MFTELNIPVKCTFKDGTEKYWNLDNMSINKPEYDDIIEIRYWGEFVKEDDEFKIPKFPKNLKGFQWNDGGLAELPDVLPDSLVWIEAMGNKLEKLPKLPPNLRSLYLEQNEIIELPELPKSLKKFYCTNNKLTFLPELPSGLEEFSCADNKITKLPDLMHTSLKSLFCENNKLTSLPELPDTLYILEFSRNKIWELPLTFKSYNKDKMKVDVTCYYTPFKTNLEEFYDPLQLYAKDRNEAVKRAVEKIEKWFLECKYNPKYAYCRKNVVLKSYKDLYN